MTRPKLTKEQAIALMLQETPELKGQLPQYPVFILGIRGYYLNTMGKPGENDRGIYDDCICLVAPNVFLTFNANTDPSRHRESIASLIPGVHLYKKGKHKISGPHPYDAFRPATADESLPVTRDGKDGLFKGIAINIHKGGYNTTSSEGCQTIYPDQWLEFQKTTYKCMDQEGQKVVPYFLVVQK